MSDITKNKVAVIANKFIQSARYRLTIREQRLILYMATLIKPEDSDFKVYLIRISDIKDIIIPEKKKQGSFYEWLNELTESITSRKISFPTDFVIDGTRLKGHINWVSGAVPKLNEDNELCIEFSFGPQMKPFLLGLKEKFTKLNYSELSTMRSRFAIRVYQMCKSYINEHGQYGRNTLTVKVQEFKERLCIADKYQQFSDLKRRVLDPSVKEINKKTSLNVALYIKRNNRRRPISISFTISNKEGFKTEAKKPIGEQRTLDLPTPKVSDYIEDAIEIPTPNLSAAIPLTNESESTRKGRKKKTPKVSELTPKKSGKKMSTTSKAQLMKKLPRARFLAFSKLYNYGVNKTVISKEFFPLFNGSEINGYEDIYTHLILRFFEDKTNRKTATQKVKALITWVRNNRFNEPNLKARLIEQLIAQKKQMSEAELHKRHVASTMSALEFEDWKLYQKRLAAQKERKQETHRKPSSRKKTKAKELVEILDNNNLFAQTIKQDTEILKEPTVFNYEAFKKNNPTTYQELKENVYNQYMDILKVDKATLERENTKQIANSLYQWCEQWWRSNKR